MVNKKILMWILVLIMLPLIAPIEADSDEILIFREGYVLIPMDKQRTMYFIDNYLYLFIGFHAHRDSDGGWNIGVEGWIRF